MSEFASCWWRSPESVYVTVQVTKCAQKRPKRLFFVFFVTNNLCTLIISGMMIRSACRLVEIMTLVCTICVSKGIATYILKNDHTVAIQRWSSDSGRKSAIKWSFLADFKILWDASRHQPGLSSTKFSVGSGNRSMIHRYKTQKQLSLN